jgi:integrase
VSNPVADLRGALASPKTNHRPAITDRREFALFLQDLKNARMGPVTRAATRFAMLTFVRSAEFRFAKWEEVDEEAAEWRVPAVRMKMGKTLQAHVVPLARQTLELLRELKPLTGRSPYLFPNAHGADGVISENTVGKALNDMGYQGRQCAHGFRATARSLLAEQGWNREAMERQLDHAERSKVVAAYARAEFLDERRAMMQAWADMIDAMESGAAVVPIRKGKTAA